jgi:DNA-binding winged helix-turn-helix (wHTH) protein/tetratricopeptide (TPR) repeat protein
VFTIPARVFTLSESMPSRVTGAGDPPPPRRYAFADFLLDTQLCTLYRAGMPVRLRPKVFQVLRYLLEHRDRPVTKDELCVHIWSARFISDASIESCIKCVRQAIGDTGRGQAFVETRRGYGYRFVGIVREQTIPEPPIQRNEVAQPETALSLHESAPSHAETASLVGGPSPSRTAPAPTVRAARYGERKLVTVLACAPANATVLAARFGLDALHSRMRTLYALAEQEVLQYEGTILSVAGTRLLAIFGAPVAQEDHARRALLAAWGLQQRLTASNGNAADDSLTAHLALHTGLVVVGGIGHGQDLAIVGDLNLVVEALQQRAPPGVVVCSETTARLIRRDARLQEIESVPVPGQPESVRTYQSILVRSGQILHTGAALRALSPFVGRAHELATLHASLAQVKAGRGQSVGIVGEPGIGKTRLLLEFRRRLQAHRTVTYLEAHCLSYGSSTAYLPILELLRTHCGIAAGDSDDAITAKVMSTSQALGLATDAALPYLLHLFGLRAATTAQVAASGPDTMKAQTFAALRQLWFKSSQRNPLVLVVEDMHWSDPTSAEFVRSLVEGLPGAALLVVTTYRPGYHPPWVEKSYFTQLTLPPLSAHESEQIIEAVLGREAAQPPVPRSLLIKAQGNPFFLEELLKMVVDQDGSREEPTNASVLSQPSGGFRLPLTVEAVLAARIDRLPLAAKEVLQTAAVIGSVVPVPLLRLVAGQPDVSLHECLSHLQAAEFLYQTHEFREDGYAFKHALTQEVAYDSLLTDRRAVLHARIVEALETLTAEAVSAVDTQWTRSDQIERLAHHAVTGQAWPKAVTYCRQAGEKAMARSAHREAVSYFEQAIVALAHLPGTHAAREQAIDLRLALRSALHPCGELERAMARVREAEALALALDDAHRLGQVSAALSLHSYLMGAYDDAVAAAERALALAEARPDVAPRVLANLHLGIAFQAQGEYRRAIACLARNVAALDHARSHTRFGELVPAVFTPAYLAACHAELGAFAEGRAAADAALRVAEAVQHPMSRAFASWGAGLLALHQGDPSRAISVLEPIVDLHQDIDRPAWFPMLAAVLGAAYTLAARLDDARALLTRALEQSTATEVADNQALCSLALGETHRLAGRLEDAQRLAGAALSRARTHHERGNEAYALQLLGDIAMRRQPPKHTRAEDYYVQALALADTLGMRPLQAHCHAALGALYAKTRRRKLARIQLSSAIQAYRAMAMTFWLPGAEAMLAQVVRARS